jgi:basic amino acid/polyamine antiporter, APA family
MEPAPVPAADPSRLPRHLGVWNGGLLLVTGVIGVGILQSPSVVVRNTGSMALAYGVWLVGAVVAVCGALVMAELASRMPRSGGTAVFLRETFGPRVSFLFAWTAIFLLPVATAAIMLVSVRNLGEVFGFGEGAQTLLALGWVGGITLLNIRSSRVVARIVGGVGILKVSVLAAVVLLCLSGGGAAAAGPAAAVPVIESPWIGFGLALTATMFAYEGWDGLSLVAGEVKDPRRTLPRATLLGMGIILTVYLAVNAGFFRALPLDQIASTPALAATAVGRVLGENTGRFLTLFIACSAATTVFGSLLCNPRIIFALAEEEPAFRRAAFIHPRWRTPVVAIAIYGGLVMAYIASGGGFERLTRYMVLGLLPFYALAACAAVVARRRGVAGPQGAFPMPLYPLPVVLMLVYVACGLASGLAGDFVAACGGLVIIAAGAVVYQVVRRRPGGAAISPSGPR